MRKYNAQGFVEALIAILIGGIAVVALMSITVRTLGQVSKNEIRDQLSQEVVLGSHLMEYLVEVRNNDSSRLFPNNTNDVLTSVPNYNAKNCFPLDGDPGNPVIDDTISLCNINNAPEGIKPSDCLSGSKWQKAQIDKVKDGDKKDSLFRIVCLMDYPTDLTLPGTLRAKIFTGTVGCREVTTPNMTDYQSEDSSCIIVQYEAVYPLKQ